jgi:hypothetical protein
MARKLVCVEWVDSVGHGQRWQYESDVKNAPGLIRTVGWVVSEDRRCITLASAIGDHSLTRPDHEQELGGLHTIVKSCIYRRFTLKDPTSRRKPRSAR